jgi:hypothetical protein
MWTSSAATSQSLAEDVESGRINEGKFMSLRATGAGASHEPTLHCPNCNHEIKLTESLAAPLLQETRQRFNEQLAAKDAEVARKTEALRNEQDAVARAREQIEDQVAQRLTAERSQLVAAEAKKAREAVAGDMQAKAAETAELRKNLEASDAKLAEQAAGCVRPRLLLALQAPACRGWLFPICGSSSGRVPIDKP